MKRGKGIVVEISSHNHVIVMTPQGEFMRIPFLKPVTVGQEIQFKIKARPSYWKWSVAAMLLLALASSAAMVNEKVQIPGGNIPAFFVTIDINPSIELAVNKEQRVVGVEGLNQEGVDLLSKVKLIGKSFKEAVEIIGQQAELDGYLQAGKNEIVVTITDENNDQYELIELSTISTPRTTTYEPQIEDIICDTLATEYNVQMWKVPANVRNKARQAGVTPAAYIAIHVQVDRRSVDQEKNTNSVVTTIERNGEYHYVEFQVTRPVLTPVSVTSR